MSEGWLKQAIADVRKEYDSWPLWKKRGYGMTKDEEIQALRDEREKVRRRTEECNEISRLYVDSQTQLTQLQALVRKFVDGIQPVDCVEVDELLREARATLDAMTPAKGQELEDK